MSGNPRLGAVLAGGGSRRFGSDKTLSLLGGKPLVRWATESLAAACTSVVVVTDRPEVEEAAGVKAIGDRVTGRGPLGGLEAALAWAESTRAAGVFLLAGDMPFVTPELITHVRGGGSGPRAAEGPIQAEPLCAWYPVSLLVEVRRRLQADRLSITELVTDVRAEIVSVERFGAPAHLLGGINEPADLRRAEARLAEAGAAPDTGV